jgi:hypothetical protein
MSSYVIGEMEAWNNISQHSMPDIAHASNLAKPISFLVDTDYLNRTDITNA